MQSGPCATAKPLQALERHAIIIEGTTRPELPCTPQDSLSHRRSAGLGRRWMRSCSRSAGTRSAGHARLPGRPRRRRLQPTGSGPASGPLHMPLGASIDQSCQAEHGCGTGWAVARADGALRIRGLSCVALSMMSKHSTDSGDASAQLCLGPAMPVRGAGSCAHFPES